MRNIKRHLYPVHFCLYILCAAVLFSLLSISPVLAQNRSIKTIKVGNFAYEGFLEIDANGNCSGYGFDYLQEIAQYTGWQFEFVDTTLDKSLTMLKEGKIDLMGCLMKSPEREQIYDFSSIPMLSGYGTLVTPLDNNSLPYESFDKFEGLQIGALKGNQQAVSFLKYSEENHFTPEMQYFETQDQMDQASEDGTIKAMIMTSVFHSPNLRVIAKFGENNGYFATTKGNEEILNGLNYAMKMIQYSNPYYNSELDRKYFDSETSTPVSFTQEELDYIRNTEDIRCVYNPAAQPISYYYSQTGTFRGITADVCKLLQEKTGLKFEYIHTKTYEEAIELFDKKDAVLFVGKTQDFGWAQQNNALLTNSFLDGQTVMVTNGSLPEKPIVAFYNQITQSEYIPDITNDAGKINYYPTITDCLEAVRDGKADITFVNSNIMTNFANDPKYTRLQATQLYGYAANTCIAVTGNADPLLMSILNKALDNISYTELNHIISANTNTQHFNSFINFLYARPIDFVLLFGGILLLISLFILLLSKSRVKNANKIRKMLYTDALTGYPNYKALTEAAPKLLGSHPEQYSLLYLDMHQFKYVNDTFGYEIGDKILCAISEILNIFVGSNERYARVYADKFVLLLKREDIELFRRRLDDLSVKLSHLNSSELPNVNFVFSCGIYHLKHNACNIDMACDRANYAKDTVQNVFSNTFVFYDDLMRTQILSEKSLESSMQPALDNGEFIPYFQPKVNVITGEIVGVEALVRWNHPKKGILPPGCFIPFFEKNGFVVKIDFTIFEVVCRILREWIDGGNQPVPISVNFSRRHMTDPNFTDKLKEIRERYSIPAQLLEIEITETVALDNIDKAVEFAQELKDNGFLVSIDDYGTGYSSIAFLQKLPVDVLKLDKSFIENAMQSKKAKDIMRQLVMTIRDNQISVVCEGIETEEQRDFMISQNCCLAQGYLYARPMPQDKFEAYLKSSKIAGHEYLEFIPMANFEQQIRSGAADFLNRVMPGWILGCHIEPGYPIFYITPQLLTTLGYSEPEFIHETGALFVNCLHPDDLKRVTEEMDENKWSSDEYILQYRLRKKGGGYVWVRDIGKKILTDTGKEAILCVCTDITDMVALQQKKDDLIGAIPGGVCDLLISQDGLIIESATDKFYTVLGHSKEEMAALKNNLYAVIYEPDLNSARNDIRNAVEAGRTVCESRFRIIYDSGSLHWFFMRGALHLNENGSYITVIGYIIDSEVQAKEDTEIIKAKMELALTLTDHAVYEYDIITKNIYEQSGLYKYITEDMTLENLPDSLIDCGFVHPEDAASFREMFRRIESGESYASNEMRVKNVRTAESTPHIWIRTILSTVYDENNQPVKAVGIVEDISRQKQIEFAYVQEEQYREALCAASILSYDIDLTKNTVDKIAGGSSHRVHKLQEKMKRPNVYSELLKVAVAFIVAAEDRERFLGDMNRTNLLKLYADGITDPEYEYRRLLPDKTVSWVSASLHMVMDKISGNILCLVHYRDIQSRKNMEESLKYNASRDSLTGLMNRASGERLIEEYLSSKNANGSIHAFMMIDVDHFKIINDTFGHQYGDTFLVLVAKTITNSLCGNDIIVRMGGDEFAVLVKDLRDEQAVINIAENIFKTIAETGASLKPAYETAVSIGIAIAPQHGEDFDALYHHADEAMYCAKKNCSTHIAVYRNTETEINIDDLK